MLFLSLFSQLMFLFPVFRQGDIGFYWYAVLSGSLDVKVSKTGKYEVWIKLNVQFLKRRSLQT